MKKTSSRSTKSRANTTKKRKGLRQLDGGLSEQSWLTVYAALILAVVLSAFLVAIIKHSQVSG